MSDAERWLWARLRESQLGVRFRRQHPIGPFITDFACLTIRLVVEVDGIQHAARTDYDARRGQHLKEAGRTVQHL
ncbi:MAG: DUF559 domain-containing protein, partial [Acidimicrobiia bacterium]